MKRQHPYLLVLPLLALASGLVAIEAVRSNTSAPLPVKASFVLGTWTGSSKCLGFRPACKDETVVYRFEVLIGHPDRLRQYADKILEGKRVPMGMLDYQVDVAHHMVRSEFTRGHTHGVWEYHIEGDSLTGQLVILPDSTIGRDVRAHRVSEKDVPPAPAVKDYEE